MAVAPKDKSLIVLFDGECNLCTRSVQFILERDRKGKFKFASMQSPRGRQLMEAYGVESEGPGTFVLIEGDRVRTRSDAALRIAGELSGGWPALGLLRLIPVPVLDLGYTIVAKNRYKLFGRTNSCPVPSEDLMERFLK
jgi:predicted DCC family thiol-disulfide oxidoreductase YuxK